MWCRFHTSPDAPLIRQRWVFTDEPFLPVGTQCVFMNRIWDLDQDSDLPVGQVPIVQAEYKQDERWTLPPLAFSGHMCHPEWFAVGEPWPVPSTLPPTKYLQGWIPECCVVCCEFIGCSLTPFAGQPASQERQYAIPAKDATADTPFSQSAVGDALGGAGPNVRGAVWSYHPLGANGAGDYEQGAYADAAGKLARVTRDADFGDDNTSAELIDAAGWKYTLSVGGVETTLTLRVVGGVGELCGTNLKVCPAILPAGVQDRSTAGYLAAGTTQATATPITTSGAQVVALNTTHGVRAPTATATGNRILSIIHLNTSGVASCRLYPASGQALAGLGVNNPYTLNRNTGVLLVESAGGQGDWALIPY